MDDLERAEAHESELMEYTHKAWRDIQLLLEGQQPQEGEDYGPWALHLQLFLHDVETGGKEKLEADLMGLLKQDADGVDVLPSKAVTPDGRLWREVLEERQAREERLLALLAKAEEQEEGRRRQVWRSMTLAEMDILFLGGGWEEKRKKGTSMKGRTLIGLADEILLCLEDEDLSRSELYARFSRNVTAEHLNDALEYLELQGQARRKRVSTGGRRREVWTARRKE